MGKRCVCVGFLKVWIVGLDLMKTLLEFKSLNALEMNPYITITMVNIL